MEPRPKTFKRGSIIKIVLENFMIYKHVEFMPGPFLNLMLGPNGSGKSAIVCSIIIGFGGDPQITGRSTNLIDYIRFGAHFSTITIEIYSGDSSKENYIIQRELRIVNRNGNNECNNIWRLNKRIVNKKVISEFIQSLNIDINNLCQVLPQERVVEFARLTPKQLLVSTEKSFGDDNMHDQHMRLILLSSEVEEIQQQIKDCNSFIMKYQTFKTNIEPDLKLVNQRKKFEEEIEWLLKKQVWMQYEVKRVEYIELKEEFGIKKQEYTKFIQDIKPFKKRLDICDTFLKDLKSQMFKNSSGARKFYDKLLEFRKRQDSLQDKITSIISAYHEKLSEQRRVKSRLSQYEQDLINYKNDLLNFSNDEQFHQQLLVCKTELDQIEKDTKLVIKNIAENKGKLELIQSEKRTLDSQKRSINNIFNQRISKISMRDPSSKVSCEWLEKNKDNFKGHVFPPIITQINVKRPEWAIYVEAAIGSTDMSTFLFEFVEDLEYFVTNLERDVGIRVNVAMLPKDCDMRNYQPTFDLKDYEPFGIFSCVSQLFTAPEMVMAYLCKNFNLHQIPVGNNKTDEKIQHLIDNSSFRRILSQKHIFIIIVSRYDNEKTTRIVPLNEAKYLNIIIDMKESEKVDENLKRVTDSIEEITALLENLDDRNEEFKDKHDAKMKEYRSYESKKNAISLVKTKIKEKERQINLLKDSLASFDIQKVEVSQNLSKIQANQYKCMLEIVHVLGSCFSQIKTQMVDNSKVRASTNMQTIYENNYSSMSLDEKVKRAELKNIEENLNQIRIEAKKRLKNAKEVSGFEFNKDVESSIFQKFQSLPDPLEDIRDAINVLKLRCEGIVNIDESILEEYRKYQNDITEKTALCASLEKELASKENEIHTLKPIWTDSLNRLINKINENFSSFMDYLNYSGEVYLFSGNKEYDFDEYGIRIKVRFRDSEPMKDLDAYHQSGGERSVSTMIYMLSLQELANVPFRVVDEINQGMDETNERCVFDLIARVSQKNSSQYFLLSPKLLTNLKYTNEMKVHIIFNGPRICVDWNKVFQSLLKKKKFSNRIK